MDKKPEQPESDPLQKADDPHAPTREANASLASANDEYNSGQKLFAGKIEKLAWSDTTPGRVIIRTFSRGFVGAAAFAWGNRFATRMLRNFHPEKPTNALQWVAKGIDVTVGKAVQGLAWTVAPQGQRANWARSSTQFRTRTYFHDKPNFSGMDPHLRYGRGLGAEIVAVTFDFSMMSIGDAATRNIIAAFDPNIKKPWMVNGHFDLSKWGESVGRASWRILSKNAGEDWAAALPYVYQMKLQRQALANVPKFDGSKRDSDHHSTGGGFKIALHPSGKPGHLTAEHVGDYQLPGAIDLHFRFVGYNWYTQMFREMYDTVGYHFVQWKQKGFRLDDLKLPSDPIGAVVHGLGFSTRYVMKSFIKANIYMQPSVIPFWMVRVPQSKWRGYYILHDPHNLNVAKPGTYGFGTTEIIKDNEWMRDIRSRFIPVAKGVHLREGLFVEGLTDARNLDHKMHMTPIDRSAWAKPTGKAPTVDWSVLDQKSNPTLRFGGGFGPYKIKDHSMKWDKKTMALGEYTVDNAESILNVDPFSKEANKHWFSRALNPIGKFTYAGGTKATTWIDSKVMNADGRWGTFLGGRPMGGGSNYRWDGTIDPAYLANREKFIRTFTDAAFAYTPYFIVKNELSLRVDDKPNDGHSLGKMDQAIYRFLDDAFTFNIGGMGQSLGDMAKLIGHNFTVPHKFRENPNDTQHPTPPVLAPTNTVQQASVQQHNRRKDDPGHIDRKWAESVTGRTLDGQYIPPTNTLN